MFKNPFSFDGRIRRSEYGISTIIFVVLRTILTLIVAGAMDKRVESDSVTGVSFIFSLPLLWFSLAQGAKRCHDLGNSGWFQLIPFYVFWMWFQDGEPFRNNYGENPKSIKGLGNQGNGGRSQSGNSGGYSGDYNGGHNSLGSTRQPYSDTNHQLGDGYNNGDLYK